MARPASSDNANNWAGEGRAAAILAWGRPSSPLGRRLSSRRTAADTPQGAMTAAARQGDHTDMHTWHCCTAQGHSYTCSHPVPGWLTSRSTAVAALDQAWVGCSGGASPA